MADASGKPLSTSLRVALTRRLAIVLAAIGVVGTVAAYALGSKYANLAYDRAQAEDVATLAEQVFIEAGEIQVNLPVAAQKWLLADEGDVVVYRVTDLRSGRVIIANGDLGPLPVVPEGANQPAFGEAKVSNRRLRVSYMRHLVDPNDVPVLVEVAETTGKRDRMTDSILAGTILFMSITIAVAVGLVWQGVAHALSPLASLEAEAARRSGTDMTPLDPLHAPTEVRGLIDAINRMMMRVSLVLESQGHFIANAAHQLRTPLAGLRLQAQLGLKADSVEQMRGSLAEVEASAVQAAHLVEQLLVLAKAETAGTAGENRAVDLDVLARESVERLLPLADQLQADLGYEGGQGSHWVAGNEVLFSELIRNLVDNALRHGRRGGRVTAALRNDGNQVVLAVSDDGPGFPPADIGLAFTRFYRPDSSSRGGAGLGLAIVHEIAERYRGKVVLFSSAAEGTRIEVRFPRSDG